MAGYSIAGLGGMFTQYSSNPSNKFAWKMDAILEAAYGLNLEDIPDGDFRAIIISGLNTGESTGVNVASPTTGNFLDNRKVTIDGKHYYELKVRPIDVGVGKILPEPLNPALTAEQRERLISMHEWARADFPIDSFVGSMSPGQEVICYYEKGSARNSNFSGIRFRAPPAAKIYRPYLDFVAKGETKDLKDIFDGSPALLGDYWSPSDESFDRIILEMENELPPSETDLVEGVGYPNVTIQAQEEMNWWKGKKECDNKGISPGAGGCYAVGHGVLMQEKLKSYWAYVKESWGYTNGWPWSAAYVSFILRGSGFKPGAAHITYAKNNYDTGTWKAFSIKKNFEQIKIQVGDVLIKPRYGAGTNKNSSHGDVVYMITGTKALCSGGNVGGTAKVVKTFSLSPKGTLASDPDPYVVILKKMK